MIEYLIGHLVGDFYFQSESLAKVKRHSVRGVILHCFLYGVSLLLVFLMRLIQNATISFELVAVLIVIGIHAAVDLLKFWYIDSKTPYNADEINKSITIMNNEFPTRLFGTFIKPLNRLQPNGKESGKTFSILVFLCDQWIHIMSILIVLNRTWNTTESISVVYYLLVVLILAKPSNILIRLLISPFDPKSEENQNIEVLDDSQPSDSGEGFRGAGERIGTLERILMFIILNTATGNFTGIAIVLTLKTIARYSKISRDAKFAEYFVIGSLTSLLIVVVVYLLSEWGRLYMF